MGFRSLRCVGSSPRVRSRQVGHVAHVTTRGIISACAEQTLQIDSNSSATEDHLRVCGADATAGHGDLAAQGSSPRVRSRLRGVTRGENGERIISACAEQTFQ